MGRWFSCVSWTFPVFFMVIALRLSLTGADNHASYSIDPDNPASRATPPEILLRVGKAWENITGKVGAPPTGIHSLYSSNGDDFELSCTAAYPIQWKISGIIAPPEVVKFQQPRRDLSKKTFNIKILIFFLDAENNTELAASARIACQEVENPENRDEVAIFVKGSNEQSVLAPRETALEGEITVIPCPSTDPTVSSPTTLHFKSRPNQQENAIENVIYDPTEGFRYASADTKFFTGGIYTCKKGSQSVTITVADSTSEPTADNHFAPVADLVRQFSDKSMEFKCSSKTKPVKLIVDHSSETTVTVITDSEKTKVTKLSAINSSMKQPILKGRAACTAEGEQLIKEWHWEFLQPPQLYLDNHEGEADCLSPLTPKIVQTVRCKDSMDCDFMGNSCLHNTTLCNFKKQKQFYAEVDTFCWVATLNKGMPCVSVPFSHLNGAVKCGVMGLERRWEFFISLDYIRYSNWKEAPLKELMRIEETTEDDSRTTSESTKFVCKAAAYLFADSLAFEIEYKNGSHSLIQQAMSNEPSSNKKSRPPILELYVKATLEKKMIPKDAISVHCLAPFWNSTDVLKVSKFLGGRRISSMISKAGEALILENSKVNDSEQTFYIGDKNKRLNCTVPDGLRSPTWLYKESDGKEGFYKNASKEFPDLEIGTDNETGVNYLEFPQVEKKHAGEYDCVILGEESEYGMMIEGSSIHAVLTKYKIDVTAEPLPASTTVFVGITILALVIVGLALAGFAVYKQKRNS